MDENLEEMVPLPPELETQLPKEIQIFRKFYFSLPKEQIERLHNDIQRKYGTPHGCNAKSFRKYCYDCGKKINRTANFCEFCGIKQPEI